MLIEIYSKPNCGYCTRAKSLLEARNLPFTEYKLDVDYTREFIVEKYPRAMTFPVVVLDGFHIGGFDQLVEALVQQSTNQKFLTERKTFDEGEWNGA